VVGIGLRAPHYAPLARRLPTLGFLEVHSENYFAPGGPALAWLERFRRDYQVSLHGVGLSLGSSDPLDEPHLAKLAALAERTQPLLISEHLCWSSVGGRHANDLLPLPFTEEALAHVAGRIERVQERLQRTILVENVSSYFAFDESTLPEARFVAEVARRSGCKLLLDVNNIHVNARNHGFDACAYLESIDPASVAQIHLGGHAQSDGMLIDTHGAPVCEAVWSLYAAALRRFGPRPTLVEWDTAIPALDVLLAEAGRASSMMASPVAEGAMEATA
jgi:uncharacterized protein (UPF0276 family)